MENATKTQNRKPVSAESLSWLEWFTDDIYPRYVKQIWVGAGVVVAAILLYLAWSAQKDRNALKSNKELGEAYVMLSSDNLTEAETALTQFLSHGPSGLARDKAYLYLGKVLYNEGKYSQSLDAYGKVSKGGGNTILLYSGALHGKAACFMQNKNYAEAVRTLEEFISLTQRRTGNPKEDLVGEEVVDWSPSVPNALWKEALCYRELKQPDQAKAVVEKLRKAYPTSPEAQNGAKLLALMQ